MATLRPHILHGVALVLVATAMAFALWLAQPAGDERSLDGLRQGGLAVSNEYDGLGGPITYRFLYRHEVGAMGNQLTLGRFVGGDLQRGATWGFANADRWFGWAPDVLSRERGWVMANQPGWRISRWLCVDESVDCDSAHLFWAIQALCFLDPESLANEIDMIERSGDTIRIYPTNGRCDYDYETNRLHWNPVSAAYIPKDNGLDWKWFETDPLIALGHELHHAWHDLCCGGDAADEKERECLAVAAENRIRHILFLKDPSHAHLRPRPGHQETWPDLPGASAEEAWANYRGVVAY